MSGYRFGLVCGLGVLQGGQILFTVLMGYSYRSAFLAVVLAYVAYHLVRTDSDLVLAHSSRRPDFWAGKVCLVTGASSGVGAALSVALASSGAKVILAARDTERLETVRRRCVGPDGAAAEAGEARSSRRLPSAARSTSRSRSAQRAAGRCSAGTACTTARAESGPQATPHRRRRGPSIARAACESSCTRSWRSQSPGGTRSRRSPIRQ